MVRVHLVARTVSRHEGDPNAGPPPTSGTSAFDSINGPPLLAPTSYLYVAYFGALILGPKSKIRHGTSWGSRSRRSELGCLSRPLRTGRGSRSRGHCSLPPPVAALGSFPHRAGVGQDRQPELSTGDSGPELRPVFSVVTL